MADDETLDTPPEGDDPPADEPLGEAGKRALEAERSARKAAEKSAKDLQAELETHRQDAMSETERALDQARKEASDTARQEERSLLIGRIVESEVRASATGKLANPAIAMKLLDLSSFVDENGQIDKAAIDKATDQLVVDEPYLAASATRPVSADQGIRGAHAGSAPPTDMNQAIRRAAGLS